MRVLLRNELQSIARERAFGVALFSHALGMTAFVLLGFSAAAPAIEFALTGALLPWTAARVVATKSLPALAPRVAATVLALALVASAGLPALAIAGRMSGSPLLHTAGVEMQVQTLSALAALLVIVWRRIAPGRLASWLGATVSTLAVAVARIAMEYAR